MTRCLIKEMSPEMVSVSSSDSYIVLYKLTNQKPVLFKLTNLRTRYSTDNSHPGGSTAATLKVNFDVDQF